LRRLGKRVAIASIHGACCAEFGDSADPLGIRDFPAIWLDEQLPRLALSFERHQLRCESDLHLDDPLVWTTYQPRPGERFYCDACRAEYARLKRLDTVASPKAERPGPSASPGEPLDGIVKTVFPERGFGFIQGSDGQDYFFHLSDVTGHLQFGDMNDGQSVRFEVKRLPRTDRAGAAQRVTSPVS
jgi:cold shock CspA family protein